MEGNESEIMEKFQNERELWFKNNVNIQKWDKNLFKKQWTYSEMRENFGEVTMETFRNERELWLINNGNIHEFMNYYYYFIVIISE